MSITRGVLAQSPEPEAWNWNLELELEFGNVGSSRHWAFGAKKKKHLSLLIERTELI